MKTPKECQGMEDIRQAIDAIDTDIVSLIARRAQYVHEAAKFKKSEAAVKDAGRVARVLKSKRALAEELGASPDLIEKLYKSMIDFFIAEEMDEWKRGNYDR